MQGDAKDFLEQIHKETLQERSVGASNGNNSSMLVGGLSTANKEGEISSSMGGTGKGDRLARIKELQEKRRQDRESRRLNDQLQMASTAAESSIE